MASSVFISYSTADLQKALELQAALQTQTEPKFNVFLAETSVRVGENLPRTIADAIAGCDFFVLLWSTDADSSKWVPQELGIALNAKKPIFPIVLTEGVSLPGFVSALKYLPAYKGEGEIRKWIHDELNEHARSSELRNLVTVLVLVGILLFVLTKK